MISYFKKLLPYAALVFALGTTSCVNDLNVSPIDPSVSTEFDQDAVFRKIYATMALTGQKGPDGNGDVDGVDEGTSGFYRLIWTLNQLPTDEAISAWGDVGVPEFNFTGWSASDGQIRGLYGRLYFDITLCNHFLEQTEGKSDEKTLKQRAETRFMRALNYYYALDFFGNVPFTEVVSSEAPKQIKRADLYDYLVSELQDIESQLFEPRQAPYGRADKAAAWLLLSRLYLNAEVYTGTAQWANAATYAKKAMDSSYDLSPVYDHLFMADNHGSSVNKANQEIILPIAADGIHTKSWPALFLFASTYLADMLGDIQPGFRDAWAGNRARPDLVDKFFPGGVLTAGADSTDLSTGNDDRALFYARERTFEINDTREFKQGFSVRKFTNLRADGMPASDPQWPDTDMPFLRLAEAYLTYAEATLRQGLMSEALMAVNDLRTRAQATPLTTLDLDDILDEKSREFYFEGHRRTDLIRFGYFGGNTTYRWQWKGGSKAGNSFDAKYNLYPIPTSDLTANPNLTQNPGY